MLTPLRGLRIGFVYDLRDEYLREGYSESAVAEFDTPEAIENIRSTLCSLGAEVECIGNIKSLVKKISFGKKWDLVFTIAEGIHGRSREAQVPALLEAYNQPYTFSDPLVCALTLDKNLCKTVVRAAGIATPKSVLVHSIETLHNAEVLAYPLFAKPLAEGTGKGINARSRIHSAADLRSVCSDLLITFSQPVLVEEYLPGREFTTAVLGSGDTARVLGTMEFRIKPGAPAGDYSYEVKEQCEKYVDYFKAPDDAVLPAVEELAFKAFTVLECRDAARVDIRLDAENRPSFIEINPLPGLHPFHSDLPMIAAQQNMPFGTLLAEIVLSALQRSSNAAGVLKK